LYLDTIIASPNLTVDEMASIFDYFWRITPFSKSKLCNMEPSEIHPLIITDVSDVKEATTGALSFYPNPIGSVKTL